MKFRFVDGCMATSLTVNDEETAWMEVDKFKEALKRLIDNETDVGTLQSCFMSMMTSQGEWTHTDEPCPDCGDYIDTYDLEILDPVENTGTSIPTADNSLIFEKDLNYHLLDKVCGMDEKLPVGSGCVWLEGATAKFHATFNSLSDLISQIRKAYWDVDKEREYYLAMWKSLDDIYLKKIQIFKSGLISIDVTY